MIAKLALLDGPKEPSLWNLTIGELVKQRSAQLKEKTAIIIPWQKFRCTYADLVDRSRLVALSLLHYGLRHGDAVGIMAGNRFEYIDVFMGASRLGCPVVLLNNTYSPSELLNAAKGSSCKLVFMATSIGSMHLGKHMDILTKPQGDNSQKFKIICFDKMSGANRVPYSEFLGAARYSDSGLELEAAERKVSPDDVINLQFTSGTTGAPKAAMLTSRNLINDARFVGEGIRINSEDVLCCPPPLFHCFGLVLGVLLAFAHGIPVLLPADTFDPVRTVEAIHAEKATILHGVPTMFLAELEVIAKHGGRKPTTLRASFGAGAAFTASLVNQLNEQMGIKHVLIGYGMTETSPITFMTVPEDTLEKKLHSVGRLLPHCRAKIIDKEGNVVPIGQRGEACTTGFGLQKGYLNNPAKTAEVMKMDSDGVLWMHTGDELFIDEEGYGHITGRIKDMIIRGGENIYPAEIEERILEHKDILEASVVGIHDEKYGEVVGAFLRLDPGASSRPSDQDIRQWVLGAMARQKAPQHVFWIGEEPGCHFGAYPKTGSGKYQKVHLRDMGNKWLEEKGNQPARAKL